MKLIKFKVTNFRSVQDSGWIDCDKVTTLVGINESGKSNLLLALWKLNPARYGDIDILHDMPVSMLSELRTQTSEVAFISAVFNIDEESANNISTTLNCKCEKEAEITVTRFYDGHYSVDFLDGKPVPNPSKSEVNSDTEETISDGTKDIDDDSAEKVYTDEDLINAVISEMPKFVYYSNYGNLSSKIYLPHAVKWLNGEQVEGLDIKDDQVRTLRVLFDFVKLDPKEILRLGKDPKIVAMERNNNHPSTPTKEELKNADDNKEKRSLLLQSASNKLTREFKEWWKQGEYKFRLDSDGDYFTIWVSDSMRPDEVGLGLRSTGLQWFLSFYLIFLVESQEQHKNAILLLDEAGLTLHPNAQKDLCKFFDNLAEKNQIINTTHSPFIVDTSNIERCRVVFSDINGFTVASSNLRESVGELGEQSIYAVHAAMGLSVSDILFQGCQTVIVEGPSDQFYFNAIKNYLISKQLIAPKQDIVFIPSGGVKGVPGVVSLLTGKSKKLPFVILDSDKSGFDSKNKLKSGLYRDAETCLLDVYEFVGTDNSEVEDLIPYCLLEKGINHLFLSVEDESFDDFYNENTPIIPQIEKFAHNNAINLETQKGWKVDLAKSAKKELSKKQAPIINEKYESMWVKLFDRILEND